MGREGDRQIGIRRQRLALSFAMDHAQKRIEAGVRSRSFQELSCM
jgi:hypothetical protein